jgi:hypothetical protein
MSAFRDNRSMDPGQALRAFREDSERMVQIHFFRLKKTQGRIAETSISPSARG